MKYVAWYTVDTIYEDIFHNTLEPTLKAYNLDSLIIPVYNHKKWSLNVAQKPWVVYQTLQKLQEPFVLLDVDCKITGEPSLFNQINPNKYDIAYHTLDWHTWYNKPDETKKELLTGTMWFNYNNTIIAMVGEWYQHCSRNPGADQPPLEYLMKNRYKHLRVLDLPLEYCYINSMPDGKEPFNKVKNPVITHYQASRTCKRIEL